MPEPTEHLVSPRAYLGVLIALLALLILTIVMAFVDVDSWTNAHHLGMGWNTAIAIFIAAVKGALILLVFMHLRYSSHLTWAFAGAGFLWLGIMLTLTMTDYFTRNHPPGVNPRGEPKYILPPEHVPPQRPQVDSYPGQPGSYH